MNNVHRSVSCYSPSNTLYVCCNTTTADQSASLKPDAGLKQWLEEETVAFQEIKVLYNPPSISSAWLPIDVMTQCWEQKMKDGNSLMAEDNWCLSSQTAGHGMIFLALVSLIWQKRSNRSAWFNISRVHMSNILWFAALCCLWIKLITVCSLCNRLWKKTCSKK